MDASKWREDQSIWCGNEQPHRTIHMQTHLDGSVKRSTGECVGVLGVEDHLQGQHQKQMDLKSQDGRSAESQNAAVCTPFSVCASEGTNIT